MLVSALSYGNWITHGGQIEEDAATACVKAALDAGITTFDTADVYAIGAAESVLGRALKGVRRDSIEIFTKVYWPTGPNPNNRGLSRKHIIESLHASLARLQTDHVDLLQAHRYDYETPLEETLRAFDDLVRQGKVHYIGVSEWTADQIADALRLADEMGFDRIVSNQPQYSLLWRVIEAEVVPLCQKEGIGQIVWSPLAQGVLTGKYLPGQSGPPAGLAGHRPRGRRDELAAARRGARAGPGLRRAVPRGGLHPGVGGAGLGAAQREREQRHRRRQPARADRRERQGARRRARARLRRGDREGARAHRRCSTPASPSARPPGPDAGPGGSARRVEARGERAHLQRGVGAVLLEDPGIAGVCDAPALVRQPVAVGVEGGPGDLEVGCRHDDPVLQVPGALGRGRPR